MNYTNYNKTIYKKYIERYNIASDKRLLILAFKIKKVYDDEII